MSGSIDTIGIRGLLYDKGISADLFKIDHPVIYYYKSPSYPKKKGNEAAGKSEGGCGKYSEPVIAIFVY